MNSLDEFLQLRDRCTPDWIRGVVKDRNGREYQVYKCECVTESGEEFQCVEDKVLMDFVFDYKKQLSLLGGSLWG